ncbi:MAG: hypothetical protein MUF79_07575 [Burkholderiales bacterium]|jgi:hypothetical protein|nr:hypothetical protein [Burkholderiales bacterium]
MTFDELTDSPDPGALGAAGKAADDWTTLGPKELARLTSGALVLAGCGDVEVDESLRSLYREYAARVADDERRRTFEAIRDHVRNGGLRSAVLAHFLTGDTDNWIVSEAAFEVASLNVALVPSAARGADVVLELAVTGRLANAGAALGGLLAVANPDINDKLRTMRAALELPEADPVLEQMALAARSYAHAATVEFWLDWMEELSTRLPNTRGAFDRAAEALLRLREAMVERVVLHGHRSPLTASFRALHDTGRALPLDRYAASIAPRFAALADAAPDCETLHSAMLAWSVAH